MSPYNARSSSFYEKDNSEFRINFLKNIEKTNEILLKIKENEIMKKRLEEIVRNSHYIFDKDTYIFDKDALKIIEEILSGISLLDILNNYLDPQRNKFKLYDTKTFPRITENKEVWMGGKCLMLKSTITNIELFNKEIGLSPNHFFKNVI